MGLKANESLLSSQNKQPTKSAKCGSYVDVNEFEWMWFVLLNFEFVLRRIWMQIDLIIGMYNFLTRVAISIFIF